MSLNFRHQLSVFYIWVNGRYKVGRPHDRLRSSGQKLQFWMFLLSRLLKGSTFRRYSIKNADYSDFEGMLSNKKWVYCLSQNNYHALSFLPSVYDDTIMMHDHLDLEGDRTINISSAFRGGQGWAGIRFLLYLFFSRKYTANYYGLVFKFYQHLSVYEEMIKSFTPQCVFFANDHHPRASALLLAAKRLKVPAFYFQHASVNDLFPPLLFDGSFLFGQYSKDIYDKIGPIEGKVFLIGDQKIINKEVEYNTSDSISSVGVTANMGDNKKAIEEVVNFLRNELSNCRVIFRKHPRDSREFNFDSDEDLISDAMEETSLDFLNSVDLVVAGDSSILLEAAVCNVRPIYFRMGGEYPYDHYEFVQNKLAEEVQNLNELMDKIEEGRVGELTYRQKALHYDASITNPMNAQEFASRIKSVLANEFNV